MPTHARVTELVDQWVEAFVRGERLTPEALCADCPELLAGVKRQIQARLDTGTEFKTVVRSETSTAAPRHRPDRDVPPAEFDARIEDLLDRWEDARARGEDIAPEALCAGCPELLDGVRQQIESLRAINGPLETVPPSVLPVGNGPGLSAAGRIATGPPTSGNGTLWTDSDIAVQVEYHQLRFHARGGLGAIYRGTDRRLNRDVAIKFIHPRHADNLEVRDRFRLESEVTGRLDHPGVVPVHAVGETAEGRLFYVMRFIQGETLEKAIERFHQLPTDRKSAAQRSLTFRDLLGRFVTACQTVAYAHNCGIVHLDIKPENILLGRFGETLVADWGLARRVDRDEQARRSGEQTLIPSTGGDSGQSSGGGAGTPAYMSPEQASGEIALAPASDIYSLGATLYKLLTGKSALSGRNPAEIHQKVQKGDFPRPQRVKKDVPRALEAVCLKAMALDPADRYRTAQDLAADVEAWLADEKVSSYAEPVTRGCARWARRHRGTAQAMAVAVAALIVLAILSAVLLGHSARRERDARALAEQARERSLCTAARFAASTIASEIDLRWRILEAEANDATLRSLLIQAGEGADDGQLRDQFQAWIHSRFAEYQGPKDSERYESWFVNAAEGTQVARSPASDSIGQNFAHRTYFHGGDRDLPEGAGNRPPPIRRVHRSAVYKSESTGRLKVAFTVPVWSGKLGTANRRVLGVLGMSVDLGEFTSLKTGQWANQIAVLVDTNTDWLAAAPQRGLVLHHRLLDQTSNRRGRNRVTARLEDSVVERLVALRAHRLSENWSDNLDRHYRDPFAESSGRWLAAFEPVLIPARSENAVRDTGWVVIVQERSTPPADDDPAS